LNIERNPAPHNGVAKHLFASDIIATNVEGYSLPHEETEKELLRIGEHFGLRGPEIDKVMEQVSREQSEKFVAESLPVLKDLTLTVVDGDFPRQVIASQNLKFSNFSMAASRNNRERYDTKRHAPAVKLGGIRVSSLDQVPDYSFDRASLQIGKRVWTPMIAIAAFGISGLFVLLVRSSPLKRR
jgi:hypothetical protein